MREVVVAVERVPGYVGTQADVVCARCGGPVQRVRRRWIDRLMSLFGRRQRYRCYSMVCGWEGNLRVRR